MATGWQRVYVFISSTFNDMHAERDYLVKQVFPRLQEWCERRKLRLVDIDLRWGVTEADATENRRVVQVCLERIDACRPFFLCFLGQRRGWVPSRDDISAETYAAYPDLEPYAGETSVTEMEVLHAFVNPLQGGGHARAEHSYFYLRAPEVLDALPGDVPGLHEIYTNEGIADAGARRQADQQLVRWREVEIPRTGRPVRVYRAEWDAQASTPEVRLPLACPSTAERGSPAWEEARRQWSAQWARAGVRVGESGEIGDPAEREKTEAYNARLTQGRLARFACEERPLAETLLADLRAAIEARYPEHVEAADQTPLQRELDQQAQFLQAAGEGFIERVGDFVGLDGYLHGVSNGPLVLTAPAGLGKTSLLARWIDRAQEGLQGGESLHYRFIGASDGSTTADALLRSLLEEIKEVAGKLQEEVPAEPDKLRAALPALLKAAGARGRTVLVLDGLNQLESGLADLDWLPMALPPGIKLVASFKRGDAQAEAYFDRLRSSRQALMAEVKPFEGLDDRRKLVRAYLSQFLKELDDRHLEALIRSEGAGNPLYLKVVLAELRVFGVFGDLGAKIRGDFGRTPVEAFAGLLRRLESDPAYSPIRPVLLVPRVFGWLAHSRTGLTAKELSALLVREGLLPDAEAGREWASEAVHGLLRQVRPYLSRRDGRVDFFFESFELAARGRYARAEGQAGAHPEGRTAREWHASLADYFVAQPLRIGDERTPNRHKLAELAYQQAHAGMAEHLQRTLWDYAYMVAQLEAGGIEPLIADYDLARLAEAGLSAEAQRRLGLVQAALRLSAHVVRRDAHQLPSQLTGRLLGFGEEEICGLLEAARRETSGPWLRPLRASLDGPGGALVRSLVGHLNSVTAVALTPDGQMAVSASRDWDLKVWDVASGMALRTLAGHFVPIHAVALTPDGRLAVSGSADETLKVWDVASGRELCTLAGHTREVRAVALAPDGRLAVSGSEDKTLKVWDVASGRELRTLAGHTREVRAVALTPDGRLAVSGSDDKTLKVWDVASGRKLRTLAGHTDFVCAVALTPDGRLAISGSQDKTLKVWDVASGRELHTLAGHTDFIYAVALTPDGRLAVSGSQDKTLKVWDVASGRELHTLAGHTGVVRAVALTPDGRLAVSGAGDTTLKVWDVGAALQAATASGTESRTLASHTGRVNAVALTPDGQLAISASDDKTLKVWGVASGRGLRTLAGHSERVNAVALVPDGRLAVSASDDKTLKVWDVASGRELHTLTGHASGVSSVAITPDGRLAVSVARSGMLKVWDVASRTDLGSLPGKPASILGTTAVALTPDGRLAVSGLWYRALAVWDIARAFNTAGASGTEPRTLAGHTNVIKAVALAPDGRLAVSGSDDDTIRVWNLVSGTERATLRGHRDDVRAVAVTPDARRAVSGSDDKTLKVWDLECAMEIATLTGHTRWITAVALTPDGRLAVSGTDDGVLGVWDLASGIALAAYTSDGGDVHCCAVAPDGRSVVVGDMVGRVHLLCLENITPGPAIATAWWARGAPGPVFGCPHCRTWSEVPGTALGTDLPCPLCATVVRLNPFVIEADWRPLAAAWKGGETPPGRREEEQPVAVPAEVRQLIARAESGDADAQFELGKRYANGMGAVQDDVQAAAWYRRAAEGGNTDAMVAYGRCLVEGRGVRADLVERGKWFRHATEDWSD